MLSRNRPIAALVVVVAAGLCMAPLGATPSSGIGQGPVDLVDGSTYVSTVRRAAITVEFPSAAVGT